uniref:CTCK domain-containing protein n=1 Tax=Ciona savignyi TaxID=51511 RepID=H2YF73_CIOSA
MTAIECNKEILDQCPQANKTCGFGKQKVLKDSHPCCPEYDCVCKECRPYDPPTNLTQCQGLVWKPPHENYNYECCPEMKVKCKASCCPPSTCGDYEDTITTLPSHATDCCPELKCICKSEVELLGLCPQINTTCDVGYERIRSNPLDECCPNYECVCVACAVDNITYPVGSSWVASYDPCIAQECQQTPPDCPHVVARDKYECPPVDEEACTKNGGFLVANSSTSGCCSSCKTCSPSDKYEEVVLTEYRPGVNCSSVIDVNIPVCDGACFTLTEYDLGVGNFTSSCQCCSVAAFIQQPLQLSCTDNGTANITFNYVTDCTCDVTKC